MNRAEIILDGLSLATSVGVEIGPLDKPLVQKSTGTVFYVDYTDTASLKARWSTDVNVDVNLLHVDAVWGVASLQEALQTAAQYQGINWSGADYIVASHVIEHVPDLVSWLREIRETLRPGGGLRLAVPDKRYSFDYLRRLTTLVEVADAFIRKRKVPSSSRILDFTLNMAAVDCGAAWRGEIDIKALQYGYTRKSALHLARDAEENGTYHDVHCWVFTPRSFAKLMVELAQCGLLELGCDWLVPTQKDTFEFFLSMRNVATHEEAAASWQRILGSLPY